MALQESVSPGRTNVYRPNSSKSKQSALKLSSIVDSPFRQKKVVELLEKNYRIHCSVHNKVMPTDSATDSSVRVVRRSCRPTTTSRRRSTRSSPRINSRRNERDTWISMTFSGKTRIARRGSDGCDTARFRLLHAFNAEGIHFC